eukprot:2408618-Rhodomonas_salina.1
MQADKFSAASTVSFAFFFFDDSIELDCGDCMGPAVQPSAFRVSLSNFPLSTELPVRDQILVRFGQQSAAVVQLVSTNASRTVLSIQPPSPVCSGCVFEEGSATIDLLVQLKDDDDAS